MAFSNIQLLPVCSYGKLATRDGGQGPYASLRLPFSGQVRWYASGQIYSFPTAEADQDLGRTFLGKTKVNSFRKDCCSC